MKKKVSRKTVRRRTPAAAKVVVRAAEWDLILSRRDEMAEVVEAARLLTKDVHYKNLTLVRRWLSKLDITERMLREQSKELVETIVYVVRSRCAPHETGKAMSQGARILKSIDRGDTYALEFTCPSLDLALKYIRSTGVLIEAEVFEERRFGRRVWNSTNSLLSKLTAKGSR